ncbi:MAG TPA: thioesterase family protein [Haliangium sp.]|nr:thioesterase family protein [Haliangium sp.]
MSDAASSAFGDLAADTAVKPLLSTPGLYTAELTDQWNFATPSGGVLMTTALRAMRAQLADPGLHIMSATAMFCAPVSSGPLAIRVEVLRLGGNTANVRASLASMGRPGPGVEILATFARTRTGPEVTGAAFPEVPAPAQARDVTAELHEPGDPARAVRFFHNFEVRFGLGLRFWSDDAGEAGAPRYARWFRYRAPQRDARGALERLAIPPVADTMPPAVWQALPPGRQPLQAPSLDLTVHFLDDTTSEWLLVLAYARRARQGYATADIEIWSEDRKLLAYGTQTMTFRPMPTRRSTTGVP